MYSKKDYEVEDMSASKLQVSAAGARAFKNAGYGLSIHWGLYSLLQGDEWIYFRDRIRLDNYLKLTVRFNPYRFNAEEWADLMIESGQKFLVITAKHHDGFCLWDTALTNLNVTNTPFKRDVLAELAGALRDRGLGLHFYYSLVDWTHPSYRTDWDAYVAYYQGQVRELCSNFGDISGIIFDGCWPRVVFEDEDEIDYFEPRGAWDLAGTYNMIHKLQPNAVVSNNSHIPPLPGEDYQVWELDLPGENKRANFNTTKVGKKPTACWWNLNIGWSYQPWRHAVKSADEIVRIFRQVRTRNAVFLLNVGPRPFGDIHPEEQSELRKIGRVLREETP